MIKERNFKQEAPVKEASGMENISTTTENDTKDEDTPDESAPTKKPPVIEMSA